MLLQNKLTLGIRTSEKLFSLKSFDNHLKENQEMFTILCDRWKVGNLILRLCVGNLKRIKALVHIYLAVSEMRLGVLRINYF